MNNIDALFLGQYYSEVLTKKFASEARTLKVEGRRTWEAGPMGLTSGPIAPQ
jgi:hypothetical protein